MINIDFDGVHRLATVASLLEPLRRVFLSDTVSPARGHYELDGRAQPRTLLSMPSWQPDGPIGVKIATVFPRNADRGLPSVNAAYLLLSGETGQPCAWIDGRALTLIRTAAVSMLAADLLAPLQPEVLLMVGTGALSRYLVEGHRAVRQYRSMLVWGRRPQQAAEVARDLDARGWNVRAVNNLEEAVRSADVISCATLAQQPLIHGAWLKPICHLDLVGSFNPSMREADDACMRGAFVAVDTFDALEASGDLIEPLARGTIAKSSIRLLADVTAQKQRPSRAPKTVFKSVGVSSADLAAALHVYERHQAA